MQHKCNTKKEKPATGAGYNQIKAERTGPYIFFQPVYYQYFHLQR